ncbi:MAG: DUF262 domain-containing protein [Isosphaeraceae bacterium]
MAKRAGGIAKKADSSNKLQMQIDERRKEIHTDGYSMSIGEIQNLYLDGDLDIHPEFQRFFRWNIQQKSRWIESILLGIPLPSVFVSQQQDGKWDVVDGLQRLSTILEFMGILRDEERKLLPPLVLEGATYLKALDKKKWSDPHDPENSLTAEQQRYVKRAKIDIKIILRQSHESAQYELFQRLNSGGSGLTAQELRNCMLVSINRDVFYWLASLTKHEPFQRCISLPEKLYKEAYDMELALRFILLRRIPLKDLPPYGTPLGEFLTEKMVEMASSPRLDRKEEEAAFKGVFDLLDTALESDSFRKFDQRKGRFTGGFSVSAFEVIGLGIGWDSAQFLRTHTPDEVAALVKSEVWSDTSFLTSTGLAAASRLPKTLERGRSIFGE